MNIFEKLLIVQSQLKAPKNQFNEYGGFNFRSLEDIVEGVKPLLIQYKLSMIISDTVILIGNRFYIEATATLVNVENPDERIVTTAVARETEHKKGMDDSQITGAASSYSRKYCLNGLFSIDDSTDADSYSDEDYQQGLSQDQLNWLSQYCRKKGYTDNETKKQFMAFYGFSTQTSANEFVVIQKQIEAEEKTASSNFLNNAPINGKVYHDR